MFLIFICKFNTNNSLNFVLYLIMKTWIMMSAMLHQPYNVILLPMQLISHYGFHQISVNCQHSVYEIVFTHILIGNTFYFYQVRIGLSETTKQNNKLQSWTFIFIFKGNSNSLATIDITAGYVGLESYQPIIIGLFLIINTYSAPIISYLTLLCIVAANNQKKKSWVGRLFEISKVMRFVIHFCEQLLCFRLYQRFLSVSSMYIASRITPITLYTIIISIQRYHLFIWTVFAPKLLYECMHSVVMYSIVLCTFCIFSLHEFYT